MRALILLFFCSSAEAASSDGRIIMRVSERVEVRTFNGNKFTVQGTPHSAITVNGEASRLTEDGTQTIQDNPTQVEVIY